MDYKTIVKAWANDLDQPAAKAVCLQFGLIDDDSEPAAYDFKDLVKIPMVEQITERYKQYLGAVMMYPANTIEYAKFNLQADVCASILKEVFGLDCETLAEIKASVK